LPEFYWPFKLSLRFPLRWHRRSNLIHNFLQNAQQRSNLEIIKEAAEGKGDPVEVAKAFEQMTDASAAKYAIDIVRLSAAPGPWDQVFNTMFNINSTPGVGTGSFNWHFCAFGGNWSIS